MLGAVRSLEERILLLRQLAEHLENNTRGVDAAPLLQEIEKVERKADIGVSVTLMPKRRERSRRLGINNDSTPLPAGARPAPDSWGVLQILRSGFPACLLDQRRA